MIELTIERSALTAILIHNLKRPHSTFLLFKKENHQFKLLKLDQNFLNFLKNLVDDLAIQENGAFNYNETYALLEKIQITQPN